MDVVAQGDREISDCCRTCPGPDIRGSVMATAQSDRVTVTPADVGAGAEPIRTAKQVAGAASARFWSARARHAPRRCPAWAGSGPGMDQEEAKDQSVTSSLSGDGSRQAARKVPIDGVG